MNIQQRTCSRCKQSFPATPEYFQRSRSEKEGLHTWCKACKAEGDKQSYQKHRAARLEKNKEIYCIQREKRQEQNRQSYRRTRRQRLDYARKYRQEHAEKIRAWRAAYYQENRGGVKEKLQKYKQENPEKIREYSRRYKARKRNARVNDFTAAQWREMQAAYDHRCAYCEKRCKGKLTQDHLTPLSQGGHHTASNIIPACQVCNSKKSAGPVRTPVQPLLLLTT